MGILNQYLKRISQGNEIEDGKIVAEVETSRKNSSVEVPEELDVKKEIVYN